MTQQPRENPGLFAAVGIFIFAVGMGVIVAILAPSSTGPFAFFFGLIGGLLLAAGLELIIHKGE